MSNKTGLGRTKLVIGLIAGSAAAALAGGSGAQHAQGDGTAQDRNQRQGGSGVNTSTRADFSAESMFRNAIVTGNAPNGLSFRGDVGYVAEREFRGELGSDDLFSFRRDSLYSGLSGLGIRGTDSLQYQFALTTGNRPPPELAGSLTVARDGFLSSSPAVRSTRAAIDRGQVNAPAPTVSPIEADEAAELAGAGMWRLRSSAAYTAERSLAESLVGSVTMNTGQTVGIAASPLGGVRQVLPNRDAAAFEGSPEAQRLRADAGGASNAAPLSMATPGVGFDGYLRELQDRTGRNAEETGDEPTTADRIREQNRILSQFLLEFRTEADTTQDESQNDENASPETGGGEPGTAPPAVTPPPTEREAMLERLRDMGIDDETLDAMRDDSMQIDRLVDTSTAGRSYYAVHMNEGRKQMADGSYFSAEARFSLALSLRRNDPTAAIARVHAQLGAGLFLSAAMNLRETLTANPLLLGARYAPDLIPATDRLTIIAERLAGQTRGAGAEARSAALLLAYVGHHLGETELIEQGLERLELQGGDSLTSLMRTVWLEEEAPDNAGGDTDGAGGGG